MTDTFARAALALLPLASHRLGWRPADFWDATPAELAGALGLLTPGEAPALIDRNLVEKLMEKDHDR